MLTLGSSILLLIIISIINPTAKERVLDKTLKQMNVINENKNENNNTEQLYFFTKAHHEIYISSYKIFLDHKIIGVGVKNFRNICKEKKYYVNKKEVCSTHSHNTYLQILTETGIVGFVFLFAALIYFCKNLCIHIILKFKKKIYFNDFEICILSAIAIYLWPFVPTGNVFSNWLNIIMVLNLPFLIWSMKLKKARD